MKYVFTLVLLAACCAAQIGSPGGVAQPATTGQPAGVAKPDASAQPQPANQSAQTTTAPATQAPSSSKQTSSTKTSSTRKSDMPSRGLNVGAALALTTGNPGYGAIQVQGGWLLPWVPNLEVAGEGDFGSSTIKIPLQKINIHQQDYLFGPRLYLPRVIATPKFIPFLNFLIGVSHQSSKTQIIQNATVQTFEGSDTAYSWDLGGGLDYKFNPKWTGRAKLGLLRTHFLDDSQSHFRLSVGVYYTFAEAFK